MKKQLISEAAPTRVAPSISLATLVQAAMIAAIYVVLTLLANAFGLANYAIQVRFSEALTILPFFTPAAVPGLFVGCILSNILTGCLPLDTVFGSLATLIGALGTYAIGRISRKAIGAARSALEPQKKSAIYKFLVPLPPIISNTLIVPFVLAYVYQFEGSIPYFMLTVGTGEVISCGVLGLILLFSLDRYKNILFRS
ncbi:MAG: QueT transporter family protein [Lachnospiraceae bacterium]|nr:QueT transporter family protein [Lachnospiraceae bacterium]